ncbi:RuvB-like protein 1 (pontin 52) [Babesia microti strain RI]|uniref:RuvB-like helicase n=1 Tax=Babesia microti (strain RI) TaxID=1133968 RepID=I7J8I1_BABMR|nr:RuvB-like protein 1 (pontin 52) [Babesia microti strain RI]CCF75413.2 RuvB-like protein 1 (pontin 52) [Babesia microti strain RI]|eukprot:XP_021337180.1 RuvB-like protein 1 (pontin 52) [Babesia microti strain RI]
MDLVTTIPTQSNLLVTKERISAHSHIRGLGVHPLLFDKNVTDEEYPSYFDSECGLIGQYHAREAAFLVVDLIKSKKMAGKAVLLAGPSGTGKTALAMAICKELGDSVPFTPISSTEVFSCEVKKTEILNEAFRKSIHVRIKEEKQVYEGQVVELAAEETENPHGGYGKCVVAVIITLKTARGTKTLRLAPQIHDQLVKENVAIGDVIYIESNTGQVKRMGRCDIFATEFDLELEEYVPLPKGEVFKVKKIAQELSLHDLDTANAKPMSGNDVVSILGQYLRPKKTEITDKLRAHVNMVVNKYVDMGIAEVLPGLLFIEEAHMLDIECFTYLNRALESPLAPIVILATNRGVCTVRGTDSIEPHGLPVDLLDRLLIIKTLPYTIEQIVQVISIRAKTENIELNNEALELLGKIGKNTSLRFCLQLLGPCKAICESQSENIITREHVAAADALFMDAKSSAKRVTDESRFFVS